MKTIIKLGCVLSLSMGCISSIIAADSKSQQDELKKQESLLNSLFEIQMICDDWPTCPPYEAFYHMIRTSEQELTFYPAKIEKPADKNQKTK